MQHLMRKAFPIVDLLLVPLVYPAAWILKQVRTAGVQRMPRCRKALLNVGVFPIRNHYYEPQFDMRGVKKSFSEKRELPGIKWRLKEQLALLEQFNFSEELGGLLDKKTDDLSFHFNNDAFESGDAEYWYQMVRVKKPRRIVEIGSGYSTLIAIRAIRKTKAEDSNYVCEHVCIEPYEMPFLEKTGVTVVRKKVEDLDVSFFSNLGENDILFIDSSHIIRPEGDVLFEYLNVLPRLNKGVIVHIHDIFSPRNYLDEWLRSEVKFWNEQYLLEAFLTNNESWKIMGALNYLHHEHFDKLKKVCPYLKRNREPGSFYMQKII